MRKLPLGVVEILVEDEKAAHQSLAARHAPAKIY
jgi:hypothetical protein